MMHTSIFLKIILSIRSFFKILFSFWFLLFVLFSLFFFPLVFFPAFVQYIIHVVIVIQSADDHMYFIDDTCQLQLKVLSENEIVHIGQQNIDRSYTYFIQTYDIALFLATFSAASCQYCR